MNFETIFTCEFNGPTWMSKLSGKISGQDNLSSSSDISTKQVNIYLFVFIDFFNHI